MLLMLASFSFVFCSSITLDCTEWRLFPWFFWSRPHNKTTISTLVLRSRPLRPGSELAAGDGRRDRSACTWAAGILKHSPSTATIRAHLMMTRIMIRNSSKIRSTHKIRKGLITQVYEYIMDWIHIRIQTEDRIPDDHQPFISCLLQRRSRESKHPNLDVGKKPAQLRRKPQDRSRLMASKSGDPDRAAVLGPCVGLWVMALTMAVMLLSGPVAAAICLFSCSYLPPLPRTMTAVVDDPAIAQAEANGDSMEHKKRVILQGLLQRNGPRTITVCY